MAVKGKRFLLHHISHMMQRLPTLPVDQHVDLEQCEALLMGFHRIIECVGLEGTYKAHLVHSPCNEQGRLQLDQLAQSPV